MMKKLPATVTATLNIILTPFGEVILSSGKFAGVEGWTVLGSQDFTADVPQEDPTPKIIAGLEAKAEDIQAEASAAVRQIMDQIQSLQCLEHLPEGDA